MLSIRSRLSIKPSFSITSRATRGLLALSLIVPPTLAFAGPPPAMQSVTLDRCNAVAITQLPNQTDYFVGRALDSDGVGCSGVSDNWHLSLFKMNWATRSLQEQRSILDQDLTVSINGAPITLVTYYDPSAATFNGETWLAFECSGSGLASVAACIAPLDANGNVDTSRLTVPVIGAKPAGSTDTYSASVPKLLAFQNQLYLYWTSLQLDYARNALTKGATTRGARLHQETSGARRMWIDGGANENVTAYDPARTVEVYGVNPNDSTANFLADTFDLHTDGTTIYALAGVGGTGCAGPQSEVFGCYRLRISSSQLPLAPRAFNANFASSPQLPTNPQEYSRIFRDPNGSRFVFAHYLQPTLNGTPAPASNVGSGIQRFTIDPATLTFQTTGAPEGMTPNPSASSITLPSKLSMLQMFHTSCTDLGGANTTCLSAISRFCVNQGYAAGGYGPSQYVNQDLLLMCMRADSSSIKRNIDIVELSAINGNCNISDLHSGSCKSAIHHYCLTKGYNGGGFGPGEVSGSKLNLTCVGASQGAQVHTTIDHLPGCSIGGRVTGAGCLSGADFHCQSQGYAGSYGILDYAGSNVVIGCSK